MGSIKQKENRFRANQAQSFIVCLCFNNLSQHLIQVFIFHFMKFVDELFFSFQLLLLQVLAFCQNSPKSELLQYQVQAAVTKKTI